MMETTDYCFSFFRKPIQNIEPIRAVGIVDVYRYIIGHYAQPQTEPLGWNKWGLAILNIS